jgi:hypothetical protein
MHIHNGELRAYLDQQLDGSRREIVANHLAACSPCRSRFDDLSARSRWTTRQLKCLASPAAQGFQPTRIARACLDAYRIEKEKTPMFGKLFTPRHRRAWAVAVIMLILAASLAFPGVRAIAVDFLGLFRVEQVTVLPINMADLTASYGSAGPRLEQIFSDNAQVEQLGEPQVAVSVAEARQLADFGLRLPSNLPDPDQLVVSPGSRLTFTVDLARFRALLKEMNRADIILPAGLDGAIISAELPAQIIAGYGDCTTSQPVSPHGSYGPDDPRSYIEKDCILLGQMPSPTISAPPGLDIDQIGKAFLQVLGLSAEEAERISRDIDWATTLVLPIPANATYREVNVDGVKGTLIVESRAQARNPTYVLIWVKDEILYFIQGFGDSAKALQMANSLR